MKKMMKLKSAAQLLLLGAFGLTSLLAPEQSSAVPIKANTDYNLSAGGVWLTFDVANTDKDLRFVGTLKPGASVSTGGINGGTLSQLNTNLLLDFQIYDYKIAGDKAGSKVGTASASLTGNYTNLTYDQNKDVAIGQQGKSANDLDLAINGTLNGSAFSFSIPVTAMFMNFHHGDFNGQYDNAASVGTNFDIDFGSVGNLQSSALDTWIAGDATIKNKLYHVSGDIHVNFNGGTTHTDVPEPATISLLGLGGLFAASRRRRKEGLAA